MSVLGNRLLVASYFAYLLSLALPAIAHVQLPILWGAPRDQVLYGMHCLLLGIIFWPGWIANPLLFAGWICHAFDRQLAASWCGLLACVDALAAPAVLGASRDFGLRFMHVGYYVWLGSLAMFAVGAYLSKRRDAPEKLPPGADVHSLGA